MTQDEDVSYEYDHCPTWFTPTVSGYFTSKNRGMVVDSPRAGGLYFIDEIAKNMMVELIDREKARLTTWLIEQRELGVEIPELWWINDGGDNVESIIKRPDLTVHARADGLLKYVQKKTAHIGQAFLAGDFLPDMYAYTESVDSEELQYLTEYLIGKGWLEKSNDATIALIVTVEGYAHLYELDHVVTDSSQAFVAMWFDDAVEDAWTHGIKPAIENAGYKPVRIDNQEFIGKIDDRIIAEIRRSRFIVADFTQGDDGARGGVYYEAGFAQGLDIPVIFTCRSNSIDNVHFDTRQYNHVVWDKPESLKERLENRIAAEIGDGPLKSRKPHI